MFKGILNQLRAAGSKLERAIDAKRDQELTEATHAVTLAALDKADDALPILFKLLAGEEVTIKIKLG